MQISKRNLVLQELNGEKNVFFSVSELQKKIATGGTHICAATIRTALQELQNIGLDIEKKKYNISSPPYYHHKFRLKK